jgi:hypothetical protein
LRPYEGRRYERKRLARTQAFHQNRLYSI